MKVVRLFALAASILVLVVFLQTYASNEMNALESPGATMGDTYSLNAAYNQWKGEREDYDGAGVLKLMLGWSKGLSVEHTEAWGSASLNLYTGKVTLEVNALQEDMALDVWLVDNLDAPGHSVKPEATDAVHYLGRLNREGNNAHLQAELGSEAFTDFEVDLVVITPQGKRPEEAGLLFGMPTLFQRLYRNELVREFAGVTNTRDKAGIFALASTEAIAANAPSSLALFETLVEDGEDLFFNETFEGNGRTCGTCHPAENNLTIDADFIATLPADDPLFVAEFNPDLNFETNGGQRFENPVLMREFGLILENVDGFEDLANKFVMRSVSHVFAQALSITPSTGDGSDPFVLHRTGWDGDGSPGSGTLREFAIGAVRQHTPKTLGRVDGVDFRLPTDAELDALEAFQLSLGRQEELDLSSMTFNDADVETGHALFVGVGRCNACHGNAGANATVSPNTNMNANFNTGVEDDPHPAAELGEPMPRDGGAGLIGTLETGFGDGTFNVPSLIEAAETPPFYHNNSRATIEQAVRFYGTDAFANSPGSAFVGGINLGPTSADQIAAFLRVLNALENGRSGLLLVQNAKLLSLTDGLELLALARKDAADAIKVLDDGNLHGAARTLLKQGIALIEKAETATNLGSRDARLDKVIVKFNGAKDVMVTLSTSSPQKGEAGELALDELTLDATSAEEVKDVVATVDEVPEGFALHQNFPNPFNPTTEISFSLPESQQLNIAIFNSLGQEIRVLAEGVFSAGEHSVQWDGRDNAGKHVATGTYLYQLRTGSRTFSRTMLLVK